MVRVNKWLDLLDRAGWTAVQAAASAVLTFLTTPTLDFSWDVFFRFVGYAAAVAVVKVVIAQRAGDDDLGAAVPGQVIEAVSPERRSG